MPQPPGRRPQQTPPTNESDRSRAHVEAHTFVRVPPHDDLAEQAVLGAILHPCGGESGLAAARERVRAEDFYRDRHQLLFTLLEAVFAAGQPLDEVTVLAEAQRRGKTADDTGGLAYLGDLAAKCPNVQAVAHYAGIVRQKAQARQLATAHLARANELYGEEGELAEIEARHAAEVERVLLAGPGRADAGIAEALGEAETIRTRRASGAESPIPLPWPTLAEKLNGGLLPGSLTVLVGGTGVGKTQWALQTLLAAARAGVPALYVGLELARAEVAHRLLALAHPPEHPVFWSRLHRGQALPDPATSRRLAGLPIRVEAAAPYAWTPALLPMGVRRLRRLYGPAEEAPAFVVLDFLQVAGGTAKADPRERVQAATYACRAVARDLNAAVLVVSSTSRANYGRTADEPPWKLPPERLVDWGKEAGEVEYSADNVLVLIGEPWAQGPDGRAVRPPDGTRVHLAVAKNRMGDTAWAELRFDGNAFGEPAGARQEPLRRVKGPRP